MAKRKPVVDLMAELVNLVNNQEMKKWAEKLDGAEHGAKAAASHMRKSLMEAAKMCKSLRADIQERKLVLK